VIFHKEADRTLSHSALNLQYNADRAVSVEEHMKLKTVWYSKFAW